MATTIETDIEIMDLELVARRFNKVIGKITKCEAEDVLMKLDNEHKISHKIFEIVAKIIDIVFSKNAYENFYRTDSIVSRVQMEIVARGGNAHSAFMGC